MTTTTTIAMASSSVVSPLMTSMLTTFQERYGMPATHIITAPGRVNLIGEHIDYAGYSVLPMAISKIVHVAFCYCHNENGNGNESSEQHENENENNEESSFIEIHHVSNASFPPGRFSTDPALPIPNDDTHHAWYHYVQCGYKGAHLLYKQQQRNGNENKKRRNMKMLVDGTIPLAAGLSSSSALVVASTVAFLHDTSTTSSSSFTGSLETLAEICRQAEGYIGTMGGGMDQAISVCGNARLVSFSPTVKTEKVILPDDAVFVIAHSLTNAEKAIDAHLSYNKRVVEMMLSCKVLGVQLKLPNVLDLKTFKQVQEAYALKIECATVNLDDMATLVTSQLHPGGYSYVDIAAILSPSCDDDENGDDDDIDIDDAWTTWFPHASSEELVWIENVKKSASTYALQERALHVYQEALRVHAFADACRRNNSFGIESKYDFVKSKNMKPLLEMLGDLMNSSHTSCKDLYDCSSTELDTLVKTCLGLGAVGSRLTGAGWGGSTVSLVAQENVEGFMNGLKETFYATHILEKNQHFNDICFAAVPTSGVSIYNVRT